MTRLLLIAVVVFSLPLRSISQDKPANNSSYLTADEISKLVNECGMRTTQMAGRLYSYSFMQTDTDQVFDKKGTLKSEQSRVFEVYPIIVNKRARIIYVQVSENGVPFSPEKIERERERAAKQTTELEEQSKSTSTTPSPYRATFWSYGIKVEKRSGLSRTVWYIRPTDFLLSHEFFAPERSTIEGRDAIMLSFRPRPGYVYDKTNVPYPEGIEDYGHALSQLGGRIWIDAIDKVIVRLEATPLSELATTASNRAREKSALRFDFMRLPTGTWVPRESSYNSYGREAVFWKTPVSRVLSYRDFKLFKTTADVDKTEPVPQKP